MTDTIIKGAGTSRSIRSVPNLGQLAPTHEKLIELLTGDGLPIDLGPINPAGCEVVGTDLRKGTLLSDATEIALWGSAADRKVDEALGKLKTLVTTAQNVAEGRLRIATGSYVGTGVMPTETSPKSLSFPFPATIFMFFTGGGRAIVGSTVSRTTGVSEGYHPAILYLPGLSTEFKGNGLPLSTVASGSSVDFRIYTKRSADYRKIYWYCSYSYYTYNDADVIYNYVVIG